jgi:RNA polymerase sigma-70 factor, ECF subfamily
MKPSEVERLYGLFGHQIYLRCFFLLREEQVAMDTVQDVYLALLDRLLPFPDDSRGAAWLMRVATNKSLNVLRRNRYWKTRPLEWDGQEGSDDPFAIVEDRMLFDQLLTSLDDRKASIVVSYFLEGHTLEEAAASAGCSVPTVRRTIAAFLERARKRMGTKRD